MLLRRLISGYRLVLALTAGFAAAQDLQFANLGDFRLFSGEVIRDCRIGYRTFGMLNSDKSNAILFPTWANGTSEQLKGTVGPGGFLDLSDRYFVVAVDALGNGVSSSPSNSRWQPRMSFPKFTIRDMVESQYRLLTNVLHINHLAAVMGISMGGMQAFQWIVAYPDFMSKAIPIVGSPRLSPYDLMNWQTQIDAIMNHAGWNKGEYAANPARESEAEFGALLLRTPHYYNQHTTRQQVFEQIEDAKKNADAPDANNKIRQAQAMMALDVSEPFRGSMDAAAAAVKARLLVIVASQDHVVTAEPALDFARRTHASLLILENDCGHLAPNCDEPLVGRAVRDFLER